MLDRGPVSSPRIGRGLVIAFGLGYVAAGLGRWVVEAVGEGSATAILLDQTLLTIIGVVLIYSGYWLAHSAIRPAHYLQIAGWCLGGLLGMLALVVVYQLNPVTTVSEPERAIPILTGLGAGAGFAIGIHRARASELERITVQLERTVAELEASNYRLEQFGSAISHDLKEPLRTLSVNLELIEQGASDLRGGDQEKLEDAIDSAARMREMVEGLLAYARIDTEEASFERVDLEAVCEDVLSDLDAMIERRDASVTVGSLPTIRGDRDQLYQLFLNLIENAIKYSESTPEVHVDATRLDTRWRLSVSDEGIGIPPEEVDAIFELFERSGQSSEREGIGLGLAMCQRIVERHGGDITVDSDPGAGSTFHVEVPHRPMPTGGEVPARAALMAHGSDERE